MVTKFSFVNTRFFGCFLALTEENQDRNKEEYLPENRYKILAYAFHRINIYVVIEKTVLTLKDKLKRITFLN